MCDTLFTYCLIRRPSNTQNLTLQTLMKSDDLVYHLSARSTQCQTFVSSLTKRCLLTFRNFRILFKSNVVSQSNDIAENHSFFPTLQDSCVLREGWLKRLEWIWNVKRCSELDITFVRKIVYHAFRTLKDNYEIQLNDTFCTFVSVWYCYCVYYECVNKNSKRMFYFNQFI